MALKTVCAFLEAQPNIQIVAVARSGAEAVSQARATRPDLAIVDVQMPEPNGLQVTEILARELPATAVILISVHESPEWIAASHASRARAFVAKSRIHKLLMPAIRLACPRPAPGPPKESTS